MRGNSRPNFSGGNKDFQNRRGGGSFAGGGNYQGQSFRGRNQMGSNRGHRNDSGGGGGYGSRENAQMSGYGGKKDENRRTLTDFKIVGLAIPDLAWTWGAMPSAPSVRAEDRSTEVDAAIDSGAVIKDETPEDGSNLVSSSAIEENQTEVKTDADSVPSDTNAVPPPPSRIRIYFHTPVTADDSRPISHNSSYGEVPSDTRKGKRKKSDDDDGDLEERRVPPPPQRGGAMNDDRSSVGASVDPSVAETTSEADWLMAAIVDGEQETESTDVHDLGDDDDDSDPLHVSHIIKGHEHEMPMHDDHVAGNEGVVLGGKQSCVACDDALGVKAPPHCESGGGLSPRAHLLTCLVSFKALLMLVM
jgi:20S proteasome subunit alpha 6